MVRHQKTSEAHGSVLPGKDAWRVSAALSTPAVGWLLGIADQETPGRPYKQSLVQGIIYQLPA